MTRQATRYRLSAQSPLRRAAVTRLHRGWLLAGTVALHTIIAAVVWLMPTANLPEAPTSVVLQLAAVHQSSAPVDVPAPQPPAASPPQTLPPSKPKTPPVVPVKHRAATHAANSAHPREAATPSLPTGDMLGNALASVHQQNWQDTSQRYAQDSTRGVQSALARYRQDWVRATQTYVDLHFPKTRRDARLTFNVTVDRYGKLVGLDMVHSTGDAALDAQAFKAVRAAAPFRPFDAGMGNRQMLTFQQGWVFNQGALLEP